jgi:hypothetical protein
VADRNERRNITKGQKAMAYAKLFPKAPTAAERGAKGGRGNKSSPTELGSFSDELLRQARAVYRYSPTLADEVRAQHRRNCQGNLTV